ncbi:hypothetical protein C8R44DRAFT_754018 [Mycena epipterygia]|nr:hypothetical protein C8R44DRAFT_754018 [Mycena epipterygia]
MAALPPSMLRAYAYFSNPAPATCRARHTYTKRKAERRAPRAGLITVTVINAQSLLTFHADSLKIQLHMPYQNADSYSLQRSERAQIPLSELPCLGYTRPRRVHLGLCLTPKILSVKADNIYYRPRLRPRRRRIESLPVHPTYRLGSSTISLTTPALPALPNSTCLKCGLERNNQRLNGRIMSRDVGFDTGRSSGDPE